MDRGDVCYGGKQGWDIRVIWFLKIRSCSQRCCGYWVCVGLRFVEIGTNLTESNKTNDYQFVTFSLLCSHPISNEKKEVKRPTRNKMDNCLKNFIYRWQFFGWPIIKSRKKILIITSLSWQLTWPQSCLIFNFSFRGWGRGKTENETNFWIRSAN